MFRKTGTKDQIEMTNFKEILVMHFFFYKRAKTGNIYR